MIKITSLTFTYYRSKVFHLSQVPYYFSSFLSSSSEYTNNIEGKKQKKNGGALGKEKSKKVSVTLALDENIVSRLKEDAELKGMSLNAKINGVLRRYLNCYQIAEEFGSCIVPSRQFSVFIEMLDEDRAAETMAADGAATFISKFQHQNIPITLESVIQVAFREIVINTGMCTKFSEYEDDEGSRCLVFNHRYGIKWSHIFLNLRIISS